MTRITNRASRQKRPRKFSNEEALGSVQFVSETQILSQCVQELCENLGILQRLKLNSQITEYQLLRATTILKRAILGLENSSSLRRDAVSLIGILDAANSEVRVFLSSQRPVLN